MELPPYDRVAEEPEVIIVEVEENVFEERYIENGGEKSGHDNDSSSGDNA